MIKTRESHILMCSHGNAGVKFHKRGGPLRAVSEKVHNLKTQICGYPAILLREPRKNVIPVSAKACNTLADVIRAAQRFSQ